MTVEKWEEIERLFHEAVSLPAEERARMLADLASRDADLARQLAELLRADADVAPVLEAPERLMEHGRGDGWEGARLGSWELLEQIGVGGMGVVHRARRADGLFEQDAAVKLMRRGVVALDSLRDFETERSTLARLSHPNIARLLDGGTTEDGHPFLVMELVRGQRIDVYCREHHLSRRERLRLFLGVCEAVGEAHRHLVVHRDIKPANILVDESGRPRLLDFGISAISGTVSAREDGGSPMVLTRDYASPEQLAGRPLTASSDVYSLAVLLHELLTEERPDGASLRVEGDLGAVVSKALSRDPAQRYGSAQELAADVLRHLRHQPVEARSATPAYLAGRFVRRHAAAVVLGVTVVVGSVAIALVQHSGAVAARAESVHARVEADTAHDLSDFLVRTLLHGTPTELEPLRGEYLERVEREAAVARRRYGDDPHRRANLVDGLGGVAVRLGAYDFAEALYDEAHSLRVDAFGEDSIEVALSLGRSGELAHLRGRVARAVELLERALELHRRHPSSAHADVARASNDLAVAVLAAGDTERASSLHRDALARRRENGPGELPVAESLNNLGGVEIRRGNLEVAAAHFQSALTIRSEVLGPSHPLTLQSTLNLGSPVWLLGEQERAEELFEEAVVGYRELGGLGREGLGMALSALASVDLFHGRLDAARERLEEALTIRRSSFGDEHVSVASLRLKLADLAHAAGDSLAAQEHLDESLRIRRQAFGPAHHSVAEVLRVRGVQALENGDPILAREALLEAVAVLEEAEASESGDYVGCCLCLVMVAEAQNDMREARRWLRRALTSLDRVEGALPAEASLAAQLVERIGLEVDGTADAPSAEMSESER